MVSSDGPSARTNSTLVRSGKRGSTSIAGPEGAHHVGGRRVLDDRVGVAHRDLGQLDAPPSHAQRLAHLAGREARAAHARPPRGRRRAARTVTGPAAGQDAPVRAAGAPAPRGSGRPCGCRCRSSRPGCRRGSRRSCAGRRPRRSPRGCRRRRRRSWGRRCGARALGGEAASATPRARRPGSGCRAPATWRISSRGGYRILARAPPQRQQRAAGPPRRARRPRSSATTPGRLAQPGELLARQAPGARGQALGQRRPASSSPAPERGDLARADHLERLPRDARASSSAALSSATRPSSSSRRTRTAMRRSSSSRGRVRPDQQRGPADRRRPQASSPPPARAGRGHLQGARQPPRVGGVHARRPPPGRARAARRGRPPGRARRGPRPSRAAAGSASSGKRQVARSPRAGRGRCPR